MNDKKHIDRLFQEKLKDFEATPSDVVWQNIRSTLQSDQKNNKTIPVWWKAVGIVAGLALLLTVGGIFFNDQEKNSEIPVVKTDSEETKSNIIKQNNPLDLEGNDNDGSVADEAQLDAVSNNENAETALPVNKNSKMKSPDNLVPNQPEVVEHRDSPLTKEKSNLVRTDIIKDNTDAVTDKSDIQNKDPKLLQDLNTKNSVKGDDLKAKEVVDKSIEESVAAVQKITKVDDVDETEANTEEKLPLTEEETASIEILEEKEEKEKITDRWSIAPNIAPVYFNSLGSGSSIDPQFNNNPRTGDLNLSYGITANYKINDKLSLRAGVNQVNLGYSVENVVVYENIQPAIGDPLKNIQLNEYGQTLSFLSGEQFFAQVPGVVADNIKSSIDQQFGFIEVPVELEYKISDKKMGFSLIGGFSSLFLNKNEVYTTLQGRQSLLGEATNIKKTSFSANIGLGFDFKISERFNLNLDPVFKYQLNTFRDTSGNFNPYFMGIYTGLSFKF